MNRKKHVICIKTMDAWNGPVRYGYTYIVDDESPDFYYFKNFDQITTFNKRYFVEVPPGTANTKLLKLVLGL